MTAQEIAQSLREICTFKHPDGRPYKDDALDTWAYLYANKFPEISWEQVEQELERDPQGQGRLSPGQ